MFRKIVLLSVFVVCIFLLIFLSQPTKVGSEKKYTLHKGELEITQNNRTIWTSPEDWHIDSFVIADSTNDGVIDLNLSVWKAGNFGSSKPFWISENDPSIKNHFFVFDLSNGKIEPHWQSSNLEVPNCKFVIADIDGDKSNELVVLEGRYPEDLSAENKSCKPDHLAVWKWNGWGFSNIWRSPVF